MAATSFAHNLLIKQALQDGKNGKVPEALYKENSKYIGVLPTVSDGVYDKAYKLLDQEYRNARRRPLISKLGLQAYEFNREFFNSLTEVEDLSPKELEPYQLGALGVVMLASVAHLQNLHDYELGKPI